MEAAVDEVARLNAYLRGRPFARIFEQCYEKDDIVALKFMCILDHEMDRLNLYADINATNPKMLALLMQFRSFAAFRYYEYNVRKDIGARILRCKFCALIAPYAYIFTHMAINHNTHIGLKLCAYCNRTELDTHFDENSLEQCYHSYLRRIECHSHESNINVHVVVTKYFKLLKALAQNFDVHTVRHKQFIGRGYSSVERLHQNYGDDFPNVCMVFKQPARKKKNDLSTSAEFDVFFKRIMGQPTDHAIIINEQKPNSPMDQLRSLFNNEDQQHVSVFYGYVCSSSSFTPCHFQYFLFVCFFHSVDVAANSCNYNTNI